MNCNFEQNFNNLNQIQIIKKSLLDTPQNQASASVSSTYDQSKENVTKNHQSQQKQKSTIKKRKLDKIYTQHTQQQNLQKKIALAPKAKQGLELISSQQSLYLRPVQSSPSHSEDSTEEADNIKIFDNTSHRYIFKNILEVVDSKTLIDIMTTQMLKSTTIKTIQNYLIRRFTKECFECQELCHKDIIEQQNIEIQLICTECLNK